MEKKEDFQGEEPRENATLYREKTMPGQTNFHAGSLKFENQNSVRCHRCDGLMAREFCFDIQDETGNYGFWAFRCMQCGEILDPLILQNRFVQHPLLFKNRARRKMVIANIHS